MAVRDVRHPANPVTPDAMPASFSPDSLTARIEVFRPGTFTPMRGDPVTYSAADLRAVADAYDPETAPAPVVVGHPDLDAPAYGWIEKLDYATGPERLIATVGQIEPAFAAMVKAGRFKKVSMAFFRPDQGHNPVPGVWYPKHVGFLGATPPAVSGLKNATFAATPEDATFTAAFGTGAQTASILRRLRDWLIDRDGLDAADKVLPAWEIDWLDDADEPEPRFAAPEADVPAPTTEKEPAVPQSIPAATPAAPPAANPAREAAFAAREAEIAAREAAIAEREASAAHADHVSFAEGLVAGGKLLAASRDKVVAILDALHDAPGAEPSVSFAGTETKLSPAAALRAVLEAQPKVVSYGALDLPDADDGHAASFAADGKPVDAAGLALDAKARAYMRAHPDTPYLTAVQAVI